MKLRKRFLLSLITIVTALTLIGCDDDSSNLYIVDKGQSQSGLNENRNNNPLYPDATRLEFPQLQTDGTLLLVHKTNDKEGINYSVEWNVGMKAQNWTAYRIHRGQGTGAGYDGIWEEDPDLPAYARAANSNSCYSGSGFDRGHICPSADRQYSKMANHQTFYYTNMQPQYHMFNAGPRVNGDQQYTSPWVRLESSIRTWGRDVMGDTLYIVKGGTIRDNQIFSYKLNNEIPIPSYFFVALLKKRKTEYHAIGFWIKHDNADHGSTPLRSYAVNIDRLEELTGFDFFCNLPDETEKRIEGMTVTETLNNLSDWNLNL